MGHLLELFVDLPLFPLYPWIKRKVNKEFEEMAHQEMEAAKAEETKAAEESKANVEDGSVEKPEKTDDDEADKEDDETYGKQIGKVVFVALGTSLNVNPHDSITEDPVVGAIHANAEKFDEKTERVFRYIQIFTAIFDSFAHGANDVANAMGPFMAIYSIYKLGEVSKKVDMGNDAYWILSIGGAGIGLGLLLYGYKIMRAIGVKLAVITPSRGFAIELGAAIVIIIGSYLGLPLSTTHCQVGATTGVALLEGGKGINGFVLLKTAIGWVITLIVAGIGGGFLVAQAIHAPISDGQQNQFLAQECPYYMAATSDILSIHTVYDSSGDALLNPASPLMVKCAHGDHFDLDPVPGFSEENWSFPPSPPPLSPA